MVETPTLLIVDWSGHPLYTCPGCGFNRFVEALVLEHTATCPAFHAMVEAAAAIPAPEPAPEPDEQEGT